MQSQHARGIVPFLSSRGILYENEKGWSEILASDECYGLSNEEKEGLISVLAEELPTLRVKIGLSQDELCKIIGISRQTYSAIETKKRKMSWNTFLTLILFFDFNEKTKNYVENSGIFPNSLKRVLNVGIDQREDEKCLKRL